MHGCFLQTTTSTSALPIDETEINMQRFFKTILYLGLLLCLMLGVVSVAAACTDEPDENEEIQSVTYTVTVTCDDAIILSTVKVQLSKEDGTAATEAKSLTKGSVSFELEKGTYTVVITGAAGYEYAETTLTAENFTATVALVPEGTLSGGNTDEEDVTYTVTVTLPDNTPIANLMVQLGSHLAKTNSAGVATFSLPAATYKVHIDENQTAYPALHTFDNAKYTVSATVLNITVVFDPVETMDFSVGLVYKSGSPVVGMTVALHRTTNDENAGKKVDAVATASAVTNSKGVALISAPADMYTVVLPDCPANYSYQQGLIVETSAPNIPDPASKIGAIVLTELGTDVYEGIPITAGNTYSVTVKKTRSLYYFEFSTDKAGYFRISSAGKYSDNGLDRDVDTYLEYYAGTKSGFINPYPLETADNENGSHFVYDFLVDNNEPSYLKNNYWFFGIGARANLANDETCTFSFTVEFVKSYTPPTEVTLSPHATQTKSAYTAPANTIFTRLGFFDIDALFKDNDGVYHYGSADGPVVLVLLSSETYFPLGMDTSFQGALLESGGIGFTFSTNVPDSNNVITHYNLYEHFLPEYIAASNSDGMHPLVEELKLFLQQYYKSSGIYEALGWPQDAEGGFRFACCYFGDDTPTNCLTAHNTVMLAVDDKNLYAHNPKKKPSSIA